MSARLVITKELRAVMLEILVGEKAGLVPPRHLPPSNLCL